MRQPTIANQLGNSGRGAGIAVDSANFFTLGDGHLLPGYLPPHGQEDGMPPVLYARAGSPTVWSLEAILAALDSGETAVCAASGMSIISQTLLAHLSAGDTLLYSRWAYPNTVDFFENHLGRFGITTVSTDTRDIAGVARDIEAHRPKLLFFEPLSNPALAFCSPAAIATLCKAQGVISVADNSLLSPVLLRPLEVGIDIVLHSLTKIIGGFGEAMGGVAIGRSELLNQVARARWTFGGVLAPQVASKVLDGVRSLPLRAVQMSSSARQIAQMLDGHKKIARTIYPDLPDYPWRDAVVSECSGGGSVITFFHKGGAEAVRDMANRASFFRYGPSFGMSITTINGGSANEKYYGQPSGFARLSIGLEAPEDIMAELDRIL